MQNKALKLEGSQDPTPPDKKKILSLHVFTREMFRASCCVCWLRRCVATGIIDLQSGLQIKPQDKLGRRTMREHRAPRGNQMTTGLSGRPKPTQPPSCKSKKSQKTRCSAFRNHADKHVSIQILFLFLFPLSFFSKPSKVENKYVSKVRQSVNL